MARIPLATATAGASVAVPFLGGGGLSVPLALFLLAAAIATAVAPTAGSATHSRLSVLEWLPAAFCVGIAAATGFALFASVLAVSPGGSRAFALSCWFVAAAVPTVVSLRRRGAVVLADGPSSWAVVAFGLLLAVAVLLLQPASSVARIGNGAIDFGRHALMIRRLVEMGGLDYSQGGYPQGIHSAAALVLAAAGETGYEASWFAAVGMLVVIFCLMLAGAALLSIRMLASMGGRSELAKIAAPSLTVLLMITGPWVSDMMIAGYLTTFTAGLALVSAAILFWDGGPEMSRSALAAMFIVCAVVANSWILLLPLVGLPAAVFGLRRLRSGDGVAITLLVAGASAALAAPVVLASFMLVGIGFTASAGGTSLPGPGVSLVGLTPVALCLMTVFGARLLRLKGWRTPASGLLLMLLGLGGALLIETGLMLAKPDGVAGTYYLLKTMWTPFAVLVAVSVSVMLCLISRQVPLVRYLAAGAIGAALLVTQVSGIPQAHQVLKGERGLPALAPPALELIQSLRSEGSEDARVVVWGVWRGGDDTLRREFSNAFVQAALEIAGIPLAKNGDLYLTKAPEVCDALRGAPDALRLTGPEAASSLDLLTSAGCPEGVIQRERWLTISEDSG